MIRIGLIGLGAIGGAIVETAARLPEQCMVVGALVTGTPRPRPAVAFPCVQRLPDLLRVGADVVIECAGQVALREHGPAVLASGCDLVPASIGLFADPEAMRLFVDPARAGRGQIRLSSGAVAGIDGLLGARMLGLDQVRYRFVMSTQAWAHAIDPATSMPGRTASETIVFRGLAREAARLFPRHANVTATISLAGAGFENTEVELVVDAEAVDNRHEIEASGYFGRMSVGVTGRRISSSSPSSRLVAGSLLAAAVSGSPLLG